MSDPILHPAAASHRGVLVWQWPTSMSALSSASVGGGLQQPDWLVNIGVPIHFDRTDLDEHATQIAAGLGLTGNGVALFTAADVSQVRRNACDGVAVDATVGVTKPTWAADPTDSYTRWEPGTINIVIQLPVGLDDGAAVNAVITVTEAKTQALYDCGVPGTGTASDAVVVVWPTDAAAERFAGPRSTWGARIAQATHAAVRSGIGGGRR